MFLKRIVRVRLTFLVKVCCITADGAIERGEIGRHYFIGTVQFGALVIISEIVYSAYGTNNYGYLHAMPTVSP